MVVIASALFRKQITMQAALLRQDHDLNTGWSKRETGLNMVGDIPCHEADHVQHGLRRFQAEQ